MLIQHIQLRGQYGWLQRRRLWSATIAQPYLRRRMRIRKIMRRFDLRAAEVHAAIAYELQPVPLQKLIEYNDVVYIRETQHRALDVALEHLKERKAVETISIERQLTPAQIHAALSYYYDLHPEDDNGYTANLHEIVQKFLSRGVTPPPAPSFSPIGAFSSAVSSGWLGVIAVTLVAGTLNMTQYQDTQTYLRDSSREISTRVDDVRDQFEPNLDDVRDQIKDGFDSLFPPDTGGTTPVPTPTPTVTPRATTTPLPTPTPTVTPRATTTPLPTPTPTATATPIIIN
jgi:uncharacterized protein (DUF433 family)